MGDGTSGTEVSLTIGDFEFYGCSRPSGEVGGDVLDVIESKGEWFAYVADVSGHGVAAGVLMSMVKSAARMRLASAGAEGFLEKMNDVLASLSDPVRSLVSVPSNHSRDEG